MAEDEQKRLRGEDSFTQKTPPSAAYIRWLLAQGDTQDPASPLHRLGAGPGDAAAGNHSHDGRNSAYLFNPLTDIITGDLATTAGVRNALKQVITLLTRLGATDGTTN